MGFLVAPLLTPLLGVGAAAVAGEALVGIGLAFGASYIAKKLQPKPSTAAAVTNGMQLSMSYDPNGPRQFAFGRCFSAGTLVYHNVYGPNGNDYLQLVQKLGDYPCDSIINIRVDGKIANIGGGVSTALVSGNAVTEYPACLWVQFHEGEWSQSADSDLVAHATGGSWSSNNRGRGVCYIRTTAKYDAKKFKNGRPQIVTTFNGARLYDWRKDSSAGGSGSHRWSNNGTHEWTDNPAVILYNYMRGLYINGHKVGGMNVPAENLPLDAWTAAANACDEIVLRKDGNGERRYRANGIVNLDGQHATFVRDMLTCMAGELVDSGGDIKIYAGVARASVMTITDSDLRSDKAPSYVPKLGRASLVNAVYGSFTDPTKGYQMMSLPPRISAGDAQQDGDATLSENYALSYVSSQSQGQRILDIFRRAGRYQRTITIHVRAKFSVLEAGDWVTFNSTRYGFVSTSFKVVSARSDADNMTELVLREVSADIYAWTPAVDELDPLDPSDVGEGNPQLDTVTGIALQTILIPGIGTQQRPGLNITWSPVTDASVTSLALEYRKVGSATASERTILDPSAGTYSWIDGVQGGVQYEARLLPIVVPDRGVTWSAWFQTSLNTAPQVVAVAESANAVPAGTITKVMLDAQTRFEIGLTTGVDTQLGSVSQRVKDLQNQISDLGLATINGQLDATGAIAEVRVERIERIQEDLALAQQITTVTASLDGVAAQILEEQTARAQADSALAQNILQVSTTLDGMTAQVQVIAQSIDGIEAKFGIATTINGEVLGLVALEADAVVGSTFTVIADRFLVAQPGESGGDAVPVFTIANVNDVPRLALRGDLIADGTITAKALNVAQLSAIVANLGTVTAGIIRDAANVYTFNVDNGRLARTDNDFVIDLKNKKLEIIF